jgi:hypothetical protein
VRWWVVLGVLLGAAAAAAAVHFLPEHETLITRGMLGDEVRRLAEFAPLFKDFKK